MGLNSVHLIIKGCTTMGKRGPAQSLEELNDAAGAYHGVKGLPLEDVGIAGWQ